MIINSRSRFLVLLFFCLANVLFSQDNESLLKHRIAWTKDDYALRYEVLIEKEENNKYSPVLSEFTEEPFIYISLPPGNYRLRVIPYDFRDIPGEGTGWKNFKVLGVTAQDSESQIVMDDVSQPLSGQKEDTPPAENPAEDTDFTAPVKHNDLFVALFAEGLGYTRSSTAFGGGVAFGWSFNGKGVGISLLYAQDAEKFIFLEALAHFRYYLLRAKSNTGLFLQAEGGVVLFAYKKYYKEIRNHFIPAAGLCAGWRFPLGRWYIEPAIRGGYPYIFGAGVSAGIRFD